MSTVRLSHVSKKIGNAVVLKDICYEFQGGRIYHLKGINGCGKTMLLRSICGLIIPTTGTIEIDQKVLHQDIDFPVSLGALIESPAFIAQFNGFTNLKLLADLNNAASREEIVEAIKSVGLDPSDKRPFRKYSLGMRQRLGVACAIMGHPKLIILDEPFNALDKNGVQLVCSAIKAERDKGALVIMASHDTTINLDEMVDEHIEMEEGRLCAAQ